MSYDLKNEMFSMDNAHFLMLMQWTAKLFTLKTLSLRQESCVTTELHKMSKKTLKVNLLFLLSNNVVA